MVRLNTSPTEIYFHNSKSPEGYKVTRTYEIVVLKVLEFGQDFTDFQKQTPFSSDAKYICGEDEGSEVNPQIH